MMEQGVKEIAFSELRSSYQTVKNFLEEEIATELPSLNTTIAGDMKCVGDDSYELIEAFIKRFKLDFSGFEYVKYFHTEREILAPELIIANLIQLIIYLTIKCIELLSFNQVAFPKPTFFKPDRAVDDMSFKDLLTCYIEGRFVRARELKYVILN